MIEKTNRHSEEEFASDILQRLQRRLSGSDYEVTKGTSLLYKLVVAPGLVLKPENWKEPSRGQYAFQTDILVSRKDKTPLVVVELKFGGFSTHDVLTYSSKALKHKEIYPYLRYGFVVGGQERLDRKFFTHNTGFDFALATGSNITQQEEILIKIIEKQLKIAEQLTKIVEQSSDLVQSYETDIILSD